MTDFKMGKSSWRGFSLFILILGLLSLALPNEMLNPESRHFILLIGVIGIWRYSMGVIHYVRSQIYLRWVYPRLRKQVNKEGDALMPSSVYLMVTSFRIDVDTSCAVYRSVIREAIASNIPTTIVASIVEKADERLIRQIFKQMTPPDRVQLLIARISGTGKRDGLAHGFRAISRTCPADDAVVAVIDGDTVLESGVIRKCIPYFKLLPSVGALTTNEYCQLTGNFSDRGGFMSAWHSLRFGQRHLYMNSMGLSRRVLTLTGRMSMFRADIICNPLFIEDVEADYLEHWRLGRFRFLTGDDKSSWFSVMRLGYETFYVPDAMVKTIEHPPENSFIKSSVRLMYRWYGNSLRQNSRALALGPARMGLFAWYVLFDQRVSMWTCLIGPTLAVILSLKYTIAVGIAYLLWLGLTRLLMTMTLLTVGHPVHGLYPILIYYNQVVGSLVKTYVSFRLDKQSWTRQDTRLSRNMSVWRSRFNDWSSMLMHGSFVGLFMMLMIWLTA